MPKKRATSPAELQGHNIMLMYEAAKNGDSLGVFLRGHFLVEDILRRMILIAMLHPLEEKADLPKLMTTAHLCVGLGLLRHEWLPAIAQVVKMRNQFAHDGLFDVGAANIGGLVGSLPPLGRDVYSALKSSSTLHLRIANFFMVLYIALNAHNSALTAEGTRPPSKRGKPPTATMIRGVINIHNERIFEIPWLDDSDEPVRQRRNAQRKKST